MTPTTGNNLSSIDVTILSALFDAAPDVAFFVKDAAGRYVTVNESLVIRHGLNSKADAIGKRPRDLCKGDFGNVPSEQDEEVLRTGQPLLEHLEMQWNSQHEPVWCLTTKLPIPNSEGKIVGIIGFSRDVRVPVQTAEIPEGFARVLDDFERTLSNGVTPSTLAEKSDLTPQQLTRFTKRIFGLTPTQLITRIRIAAASRMLRDTNKTVAEIAVACGFYDHSAFTRAFRNATSVTPSAFRNQES
ncbi:MAG: AraC family transcriptional regulator [Planctomycetaceae bacterium]|nr:AraC family transcriptional regulator [Planctomycetaceae bacterium]